LPVKILAHLDHFFGEKLTFLSNMAEFAILRVHIFFEIICFSDSTGKINDFSFYLSEKYAFLAI